MTKGFLFIAFFIGSISVFAQKEYSDNDTVRHTRKLNHYIGIQANQLFRQILNLSNTNTAINNPYIFNYSLNGVNKGWGLNASIGVDISNSTTGDNTFKRKTEITGTSIRIGFEKKSFIGKKWLVSWGLDAVSDAQDNTTTATSDFGNNNKSSVKTTSKIKSNGGGPRITISYKISEKVLIGTESNYYYRTGKNESTVRNTTTQFNPNTGQTETTTVGEETKTSEDTKSFDLAVPVALFLIVKF